MLSFVRMDIWVRGSLDGACARFKLSGASAFLYLTIDLVVKFLTIHRFMLITTNRDYTSRCEELPAPRTTHLVLSLQVKDQFYLAILAATRFNLVC